MVAQCLATLMPEQGGPRLADGAEARRSRAAAWTAASRARRDLTPLSCFAADDDDRRRRPPPTTQT
jgi:hypothetical protein